MSYNATQVATRRSSCVGAPDPELVAAVNDSLATGGARGTGGRRRRPGARQAVAWMIAILGAGAVALTAAAILIGGATGTIFAYAIVPDLGMAAIIALCWTCYRRRHTAIALRGDALRRALIDVPKA